MADRKRQLLRPEDATSWEEFQARSAMEQTMLRGSTGSWKNIGLSALSGLLVLISIAFWYVFAVTPGGMRWAMLVLALIPTGLLAWVFGGVMRRGFRGSQVCAAGPASQRAAGACGARGDPADHPRRAEGLARRDGSGSSGDVTPAPDNMPVTAAEIRTGGYRLPPSPTA